MAWTLCKKHGWSPNPSECPICIQKEMKRLQAKAAGRAATIRRLMGDLKSYRVWAWDESSFDVPVLEMMEKHTDEHKQKFIIERMIGK